MGVGVGVGAVSEDVIELADTASLIGPLDAPTEVDALTVSGRCSIGDASSSERCSQFSPRRRALRLSWMRANCTANSNRTVSASARAKHGERVRPRGDHGGEHEQTERQAAPPRLESCVAENPDQVERHDDQRHLEADAEDDQQMQDETEVLPTVEGGHLNVVADGEQEVERLRDHQVRQDAARDEQRRGRGDERDAVLALVLMQTRA